MKKIVVFGGGTGLSCLLSGLKLFPLEVTTVISVSDNGSSTGKLKEELNIPAVGDIGKVLLSMANVDEDFKNLLGYRFSKGGSLQNHPVRNIILAALIDMKGNLTEATKYMCSLLNIKGTVLPLTEEKVELVGEGSEEYFGEVAVGQNIKNITRLSYDHDVKIEAEVKDKIAEADLIIFSSGSLYTSILPHLLASEVRDALARTNAPLMYVSNLVTQPGETDIKTVSGHVQVLNEYLKDRHIDVVVANDGTVSKEIMQRYLDSEGKEMVIIDRPQLHKMDCDIIEDNIFSINEEDKIRHNALKTAYLIFSYLMEQDENRE